MDEKGPERSAKWRLAGGVSFRGHGERAETLVKVVWDGRTALTITCREVVGCPSLGLRILTVLGRRGEAAKKKRERNIISGKKTFGKI